MYDVIVVIFVNILDKSIKNMDDFNDVCGKVENNFLDKNQINSIIHNDDNQLIIAGAGSGKTTTIIGKIKYLVNKGLVSPNEILLLSFTNASAKEMKSRVQKEIGYEVETYTFHKLGLEIVKKSLNEDINIYSEGLSKVIIDNLLYLLKNKDYYNKFMEFLNNYIEIDFKNYYEVLFKVSSIFETIVNLIKSNNYSLDDFKNICVKSKNNLIFDLIEPIYENYNKFLVDNNLIDFNDMINKATLYVRENRYIHNYKYVIVDEYQDISKSRFNLLKALRKQKFYKLFCVGDDWQSIYRFSGSDIGLITNFKKYWGNTYISKIENTYRFSDKLAKISSKFVMKNPNQIRKCIKGYSSNIFPLSIICGKDDRNCLSVLEEKLKLLEYYSNVFFIGRYSFDIDILKLNDNFYIKYNKIEKCYEIIYSKRVDLNIKFLTAHKSKGLQADYVVVLNNKNGIMGFPSKVEDMKIINLLLDKSDNYPYSEERRLFYVSITRSKKKTFLLVNLDNKSIFIKEIEKMYLYKRL